MFSLYREVIKKARKHRIKEIERLRNELKANRTIIDVTDFKTNKSERKTIGSVAKTSLSSARFSSFLYHLGIYLKARTVLETGTSLGINTLYLSKIPTIDYVVTIEGSPIIADMARKNFQKTGADIELINRDIYSGFTPTLIRHAPDLIFIDADHRGSSVRFCLEEIMEKNPTVKCIVIHDVNWSKDMNIRWKKICKDKRFPLTVDIFQAGLVFPNIFMPKQHFVLRF